MTVRLPSIPLADDSTNSYVGHRPLKSTEIDVLAMHHRNHAAGLPTTFTARLIVSAARYELREGHPFSRRWRAGVDSLPSIKGLVAIANGFDDYGNNVFADVEYNSHGHRATYGGHFDPATGLVRWTCYMD